MRHRSSSTRGDETLTVQPAGAVVVHFWLRPLAEGRTPAVSGEAQSGSVSVVSRAVEKQTDVWGHGFSVPVHRSFLRRRAGIPAHRRRSSGRPTLEKCDAILNGVGTCLGRGARPQSPIYLAQRTGRDRSSATSATWRRSRAGTRRKTDCAARRLVTLTLKVFANAGILPIEVFNHRFWVAHWADRAHSIS